MEVPGRPRPASFTTALQHAASRDPRRQENDPGEDEEEEEGDPFGDGSFGADEQLGGSVEASELAAVNASLSSRSSFSEGSAAEEEPPSAEDAKKKSEEEEAAAKERAAQRQVLAIEELVQSERNYLRMLRLSTVTIRNNLQELQPPPADLDSAFLDIDDVIDVSNRLLGLLDRQPLRPGDPLFLEALCESFLGLSPDIEASYREYLARYSQVTLLENSYKQDEALWNRVVGVIKSSAPDVNATSLSFFLVMPVQRIARYPLLLQTIRKHTETSHPAYALLERTAHTAIALNYRINEYKRFREVADKYKKTETLTMKDKIYRLNSHSIAKKTARFSQHFKHETGMAPKVGRKSPPTCP
ncbi:Rho guanine nucleotide exchange factor 37 [Liparis tanakae]|uniref:Rho guanine nucleotide exchange factor 37 n=1 Tax=Liparis tanakae TaxID=230148 RepID=A0A4Z2HMI6_9TELE|nr:Rho guanine nucleotide exchange factor 37 [Liparis tanakae]